MKKYADKILIAYLVIILAIIVLTGLFVLSF